MYYKITVTSFSFSSFLPSLLPFFLPSSLNMPQKLTSTYVAAIILLLDWAGLNQGGAAYQPVAWRHLVVSTGKAGSLHPYR